MSVVLGVVGGLVLFCVIVGGLYLGYRYARNWYQGAKKGKGV